MTPISRIEELVPRDFKFLVALPLGARVSFNSEGNRQPLRSFNLGHLHRIRFLT
jgi:hypothetical protein